MDPEASSQHWLRPHTAMLTLGTWACLPCPALHASPALGSNVSCSQRDCLRCRCCRPVTVARTWSATASGGGRAGCRRHTQVGRGRQAGGQAGSASADAVAACLSRQVHTPSRSQTSAVASRGIAKACSRSTPAADSSAPASGGPGSAASGSWASAEGPAGGQQGREWTNTRQQKVSSSNDSWQGAGEGKESSRRQRHMQHDCQQGSRAWRQGQQGSRAWRQGWSPGPTQRHQQQQGLCAHPRQAGAPGTLALAPGTPLPAACRSPRARRA